MNLTKDAYEYLMNFADDRTILNMLSVNKKFNDEYFFERIMIRKYPFLVQYAFKRTWKDLFIKMTYYIAKLEEEFGIPYIPDKTFNPERFYPVYKNSINTKHIYNDAMAIAARSGNLDIVKLMVEKGAVSFDLSLVSAATEGHIHVINYLIGKGAKDFDRAMSQAAYSGRLNIIKFMVEKGARNFNRALLWAIRNPKSEHLEVIKYLINQGANNIQEALNEARLKGKQNIAEYLQTLL